MLGYPHVRQALFAGLALLTAGCSSGAAETEQSSYEARIINADAEPGSWLSHGRDYAEQRFSPLDQVDVSNVGRLNLTWTYEFDTSRGQEATPIVADGVLYTTTAWSKVFAFDAASGKLLWSFDPKVPGKKGYDGCCDVVNRGVAVTDGKVYLGSFDGRLIALDAKTGKEIWSTLTVDPSQPYTITGAPRVVRGKVLIGNGGAEYGVRGYVSAYDAQTGKLAWRFYTVPNPEGKPDGAASDGIMAKLAGATWGANGKWKETGGGGTVWDAIVYDEELDQVLIGVGNGSPWNHKLRSGDDGDNLFLSSIVALDPDTGEYKWHYQETPGETWDFTASQNIILADLEIDGKQRQVMMQMPKNGFFFVIDRHTGVPISIKNVVPVNWAEGYDPKTWRPIVKHDARWDLTRKDWVALPSAFGAHNWHPMAFSPLTGLVYIPVQLVPFPYRDEKDFKFKPGHWNLGNDPHVMMGPRDKASLDGLKQVAKGELVAWDPVSQSPRWRVPQELPSNGGVLATAGNLVFQGTGSGEFRALRADTGEVLWTFKTPNGIIAPPISYAIDGQQYIAVMAGYGGSAGLSSPFPSGKGRQPNGRILVFKLDGTAKLPKVERVMLPANPPKEIWPASVIDRGEFLYGANCGLCHGPAAYNAGVLPDLRRSPYLTDKDAWQTIVHDGALEDQGMIGFANQLTPEEIESIRAFIGQRAQMLSDDEKGS
ncbi:alcohol dehydrogenase [Croceicoccus estronivorus]|uniref:PQQ-dependent dehydrogenase, methanol/ethanol family n=1 Tax=Croceicoccus estronivorus TaxID=1172626 RepID=UPI0008349D61|nr:PQQ-dependent dehydrogenase, methanol/ethanol family [Croceicoccus estronivorus]OCC23386.1 alcohol dehydrogenase [Croceicoccus estronivorus]